MKLMKIVIFVHLAQGAWLYSNPLLFPKNDFYKEVSGVWILDGYYQLYNRVFLLMKLVSAYIYVAYIALFLVLYIFKNIIIDFLFSKKKSQKLSSNLNFEEGKKSIQSSSNSS
jgi:hypothetical protein